MRLELFDVRRRWPRQRTQRDDERGFVNSGILFSLSSSVQFVGLILPSNSHAEIKPRLYASAIFPISGDWDVLLPLIWNCLCDRRRAEITVMQFTGHSLPVHHWNGTFTLSHIISRAHLRDFFRLLAIGHLLWGVLPLCRCAIGVFYIRSQLGKFNHSALSKVVEISLNPFNFFLPLGRTIWHWFKMANWKLITCSQGVYSYNYIWVSIYPWLPPHCKTTLYQMLTWWDVS